MFKGSLVAATLMCLSSIICNAEGLGLDESQIQSMLKTQIDGSARLPGGLTMIEANGKSMLISGEGRIVVIGKVFDLWNGVELKNLDDVEKYAYMINLKKLGIQLDELGALSMGKGPKEIVVFIDPSCSTCRETLKKLAEMDQYTFKILLLPTNKQDSVNKVKKGICGQNKGAVLQSLVEDSWEKIPAPNINCILMPMYKTSVASRMLGITEAPFFIRDDGIGHPGEPKDIDAWLSGKAKGFTDVKRPKTSK
jgi:thiol:disulfide interchange protein DsbC